MNQIIQASLQGNEFTNKSFLSRGVSTITSSTEKQMDTEYFDGAIKKVHSTCDSIHQTNSTAESHIMKCENTPQIQQKLESLCIDEESFNLDEILFNECENLSHISENANSCEKWQEESIHSLIYEQKISEEEEERRLREKDYFCILKQMEEYVKIERIPEHIKNIVETQKFKIVSLGPLKLQCQFGHHWETKFDDLIHQQECQVCIKLKSLKLQSKHGKCALNPQNLGKTRCRDCKQQHKQQIRKQRQENIKYTNEKNEKIQNDLYMRAVKILSQDNNLDKQRVIRAFRETEVEVDKAALNHAMRYCAKESISSQTTLEQISAVYKLLLLPEKALRKYVQSQQRIILKQEYKTYAKSIHPDKNSHPQCAVAFQKLRKFWVDIPKTGISDISSSMKQ